MSWDDEDADWDAPAKEDAAPATGLTDKWDGEDEDDDTLLGDDWDADPDEKKEVAKKPVAPVAKKLTKRQLAKKKEEEERLAKEKRAQVQKEEEDDPEAAARRRAQVKAAIEKSNLNLVADCFGGDGYEAPEDGEFQNDQLDLDNTDMIADVSLKELKNLKVKKDEPLENVELKTTDDFKKFGTKVAKLVEKAPKQKLVVEFLKVLLTEATKGMKLDEATEIKKSINVICTQKQKDEQGKKKKNNKKAQLTMSRSSDPFGGDDDGDYGDGMDDFL